MANHQSKFGPKEVFGPVIKRYTRKKKKFSVTLINGIISGNLETSLVAS